MDATAVDEVPWIDGQARCALCGSDRDVAEHALTHGVRVTLCGPHRARDYLHDDGGHTIAGALETMWASAGCLTVRRRRALGAHPRRVAALAEPPKRRQPGSYAWPHLREEAERRFAAGEDPVAVMTDLRVAHEGDARVPALRTMRRWFTEARWRRAPDPEEPPTRWERVVAALDSFEDQMPGAQSFPGLSTPFALRGEPRRRKRRRRRRRRR